MMASMSTRHVYVHVLACICMRVHVAGCAGKRLTSSQKESKKARTAPATSRALRADEVLTQQLKAALALSEWELQRSACSTRSPRKEGESKKARLEEPSLGLSVDETPSLADIMGDEVSSLVWER